MAVLTAFADQKMHCISYPLGQEKRICNDKVVVLTKELIKVDFHCGEVRILCLGIQSNEKILVQPVEQIIKN